MEMALKKAEQELAAARAEHRRYLEVAFPATLVDARVEAVEEYLRVDWSFVPEESEETAAEGAVEEGEVTGAAPAPENVVVLDDPDQPEVPDQPIASKPPAADQQTSPALNLGPGRAPFWVTRSRDLTLWSENHRGWNACKGRWVLVELPFWVARSKDLTLWSENHRGWNACKGRWVLVGLPFWVARSKDLTLWYENHRGWGLYRQILYWVLVGHVQFWSVPDHKT
ncbi:hypothetical protein TIFTF001_016463 [Ficus carica]|uniref:Uncharacterized protein n=1 Tax=Ficus carica TaxID=3494 RepID=A0AA88A358_FICCA|nr:hypothetical protein TIFTF001_016463 [Ficus carica]